MTVYNNMQAAQNFWEEFRHLTMHERYELLPRKLKDLHNLMVKGLTKEAISAIRKTSTTTVNNQMREIRMRMAPADRDPAIDKITRNEFMIYWKTELLESQLNKQRDIIKAQRKAIKTQQHKLFMVPENGIILDYDDATCKISREY